MTKKISQEFNRTEIRILDSLSQLDLLLLNPQVPVQSRTVAGTSGKSNGENEEPNEDRSQKDPHPEAEVVTSVNRSPQFTKSDPDEASFSYCMVFFLEMLIITKIQQFA